MEVSVAQGYTDGIVSFLQHLAYVIGEVQRSVGGDGRVQRDSLALGQIGPQGIIRETGHKEVFPHLFSVDPGFEIAQPGDKEIRACKAVPNPEFFPEQGIAGIPSPALVGLPGRSYPFGLPGAGCRSGGDTGGLAPGRCLVVAVPDSHFPVVVCHRLQGGAFVRDQVRLRGNNLARIPHKPAFVKRIGRQRDQNLPGALLGLTRPAQARRRSRVHNDRAFLMFDAKI